MSPVPTPPLRRPFTVVSLFDGISCGREALRQCGLPASNVRYYASEIDRAAMRVANDRFPHTVQLGDVRNVQYRDNTLCVSSQSATSETQTVATGPVDLLLAGSPCQGFSSNGDKMLFDDPRSALYFEFERLLQEIRPTHFLLENVVMPKDAEEMISKRLKPFGGQLYKLNSRDWSAQNRPRLYWTNIPHQSQSGGQRSTRTHRRTDAMVCQHRTKHRFPRTLKAVVGKGYGGVHHRPHGFYTGGFKPLQEKGACITRSGWLCSFFVHQHGKKRKFTAEECELLQTLPKGYTRAAGSDNARVALIGNAWTVAVIADLLRPALAGN